MLAAHKPRAIVHFAAESHVDRSILGPEEFVRTNIIGTFTLLEAARAYWSSLDTDAKSKFRFLHVSTDEVYGSLLMEDAPFAETHPYQPNSPYSASKAGSDHLVRSYFHTYGLPVVTTNCSNNYGPFQFPEKLIPLMIANALGRQAAAGLRRRAQRARLALRRGPLRGHPPGAGGRQGGRDLQRRRQQRDAEHRHRPPGLRAAGRAAPGSRRARASG